MAVGSVFAGIAVNDFVSSLTWYQRSRWSNERRTKCRKIECPCGSRLEARNDEELAREVLNHGCEEHNKTNLTEERAREMVAG